MLQSMKFSELFFVAFALTMCILICPACAQYDEVNVEHDLLSLVYHPENIESGNIQFTNEEGSDYVPNINRNANLRSPALLIVPSKLNEFTILAKLKTSRPEGYLFSIVNSLETLVQLGIKISAPQPNKLNVSLIYNDPGSKNISEYLATFSVPYESGKWMNFAIQVWNDKIVMFYDCIKLHEVSVLKEPKELIFESSSILYLSQAGSGQHGQHKFEV